MTQHTILVVDDDYSIRETFARYLAEAGYIVETAASAESAIAAVGAVDPGLIITDVRMSGMTGMELLAAIRESLPDVDVIVITAHQDMETAMAAIKAGAYDYLVKPIGLDQLEIVVARCFRDRDVRRRASQLAGDAARPYELKRLIGGDPKMIEISKTIGSLTANRATILIRGETGTGKEVIARTIHFNSAAKDEPFVAVNCTAIPEQLLESELFGHVRGAFTGAVADRRGRFELAGAGTIFLDEIGDVSPAFQAKLLRVLQDGEFFPVGSERSRRTTARVMAATHRPLEELVRTGLFREDLYFRLRVVEIVVPPLRDRATDIRPLAEALLARVARDSHKTLVLSPQAMRAIERYAWPGNIRELENALTRSAVLARSLTITEEDLSLAAGGTARSEGNRDDLNLQAVIHAHVTHVLGTAGGNKRQAARLLGVSRQRLDRILQRDDVADRNPDGSETQPM